MTNKVLTAMQKGAKSLAEDDEIDIHKLATDLVSLYWECSNLHVVQTYSSTEEQMRAAVKLGLIASAYLEAHGVKSALNRIQR